MSTPANRSRLLTSLASTAVMIMAIVANVRKAADVMLMLGRPGTLWQSWDAIVAAVALEAGFALFAFFLAHELRGRRQHLRLLVLGTLVMGTLSAVANIAYYTHYSPAQVFTWEWTQAVVLGLSAPTVAIMTAILAGVVDSINVAAEEAEVEAEDRRAEQALLLAKEQTAQARAEARKAKALAGTLPEVAGTVRVPAGNGRMTPEKLLAKHPDAATWTGKQIAEAAGVSARTGRNWARKMRGE